MAKKLRLDPATKEEIAKAVREIKAGKYRTQGQLKADLGFE